MRQNEPKKAKRKRRTIRNAAVLSILMLLSSAGALLCSRMQMMNIVSTSMYPVLMPRDTVLCAEDAKEIGRGDLIAFSVSEKVLIKRVIGLGGDVISIDDAGCVTVNGTALDEPYVSVPVLQPCDLTFPVTVPEGTFFVLSDMRSVGADSRSDMIGSVPEETVIGELIMRIWPPERIGSLRKIL